MREDEAEIGLLALEKGLINQRIINDCLTEVAEGRAASLTRIFTDRALIDPAQLDALRKEAVKRVQDRAFTERTAIRSVREAEPKEGPDEALEAAKDPRNHFGKYVLVLHAGKSATGEVWKAWDAPLKRWVALKLLREASSNHEAVKRFYREAKAIAALRHPGIVVVHEADWMAYRGTRRAFIAMDFIQGETLDKVQAKGIDVRRAAEIARDASRAVAFAHARGVIHRDLNPRNIMIDTEGQVRVMGFGLPHESTTLNPEDDVMLSRTIRVMGTPSYMSPEQALGRTSDIRERSDVYSLGATLYFLATGKPPFHQGSSMRTCFAVVRDPLVLPSKHNESITPDLERVIVRAMAKDPVRRYESAEALAQDLDRFLQSMPVLTDDQLRYAQGLEALRAGRLEEAVHMFKELLRLEITGGAAVTGCKEVFSEIESGEQGLTLAIKQQPKNYDIRTNRGVYRFAKAIIQSLRGSDPSVDSRNAMQDFVAAADLRPEYTPARINRANILIFGGRYARESGKDVSEIFNMALKDLTAAIEFEETCSPAFHNRGIVHFYIGREIRKGQGDREPHYRRAIADFSRAAELDLTYAYIFKDLGVVKNALAKYLISSGGKVKSLFEEALSHFSMAIDLNPSIYGAHYGRGQAHFALKNFKEAIGDFKRCLQLEPERDKKRIEGLIREAESHMKSRSG